MTAYTRRIFDYLCGEGIIPEDGKIKFNQDLIEQILIPYPLSSLDSLHILKVYNYLSKAFKCRKGKEITVTPSFIKAVFNTSDKVRLTHTPTTSGGFNHQACFFVEKGMIDKALAAYTKAIELDPKRSLYWGNRGWLLHKMGEYERAIKDFTEAISLVPEPIASGYYISRAETFHALGSKKKAIKDGVRAVIIILYRLFLQIAIGRGYMHPHCVKRRILSVLKILLK